jgi:hypothetical protein
MHGNDRTQDREGLEDRVARLEARTNDLVLKSRIAGSLFGKSGLDLFFDAPEFWENTYDSGEADCSLRCINDLTARRKVCAAKPTAAERLACEAAAVSDAVICQSGCSQSFPRPIF